MCRKVVLTKAQAEEFENFKKLRNGLEEWARDKYDPNAPNSVIHNLTFDEVAHAYYIGYEIEPEQSEFQPGDKVVRIDGQYFSGFKNIEVIERVKKHSITLSNSLQYSYDFVRHATPEEIYWLETLGRDSIKDFRIGDIYIDREYRAEILENDRHVQLAQIWHADEDFKGLYPAESFRLFKKE